MATAKKTTLKIICTGCDDVETNTIVQAPEDALQTQLITENMETVVEEHQAETDGSHAVELTTTEHPAN